MAEATIIKWNKNPGDYIETDETVMEIATDKVDSDVPSPVSGKLLERLYNDNDVVQVGAVIAIIETADIAEFTENISQQVYHPFQEERPPVEAPPQFTQQTFIAPQQETVIPPVKNITQDFGRPAEPEYNYSQHVPFTDQLGQKAAPKSEGFAKDSVRFYSPLVRNIAAQEGISSAELDAIPGTGADNRLTKDDLLNYIQQRQKPAPVSVKSAIPVSETPNKGTFETFATPEPVTRQQVVPPPALPDVSATINTPPVVINQPPVIKPIQEEQRLVPENRPEEPRKQAAASGNPAIISSMSGKDEIIEMDRMRRLIADHMVMSKQTSAHVTSFVEADVTNLVLWREKVKSAFEKREGTKITFTPLFIEAVVMAIKDFPMINVSVNGTQIIKKKDINISMATALANGNLIVPVIKRADELNIIGLTKAVNDLADRARNNKLKPDDVQDGTFTITNVGSFGNIMGTPIINQPQVAILAVGAIKKKPAVIETLQGDMICIRHMMFLSLSYDHRVVDGALGGSFVRRVADYLENWDIGREY